MFDLNPKFPNNFRHRFNDDVHFRLDSMDEDSGVCSPPLWDRNDNRISPPHSPERFPNPRTLSPASRARAIANGRREMMEMVENMNETSYELSLKDLVEKRREFIEERPILMENRNKINKINTIRNSSMNYKNSRSSSNNKGLLINMVFPFSIGLKKKKSRKMEVLDKGGDHGDWWWKKFTGSGDSESLGITSGSGDSTGRSGSSGSSGGSSVAGSLHSNSNRRKNNCSYGCWSFFPSRKKKSYT